jgi:hypothetical protein
MTARLGDSAALELVRAHDALVRRGLGLPGGAETFGKTRQELPENRRAAD